MKARQKLKYSLLMDEVIQQLKPYFKPKVPVIKVNFSSFWKMKDNGRFYLLQKCIDILIEKEYLKRQSDEADVLCYVT
jgi:hypothetical protein